MDLFVARQPIFNRNRAVYGHELLFRSGLTNAFSCDDPDRASLEVLDQSYFVFGLQRLVGDGKAFINFTRDTLVNGYAELLPSQTLVVEVLEDVHPDDEVIEACRKLHDAGFSLALDDFVPGGATEPLVPMADLIKVDFTLLSEEDRYGLPRRMWRPGLSFLAEKVETEQEFLRAAQAGYTYFQGYFFSKPAILTSSKPSGLHRNHIAVLEEMHRPQINIGRLTSLIEKEAPLAYRVFRLVNSAAIGLQREVRSIKQALLLLGEAGIRKWIGLMVLASMGSKKPPELLQVSATRAWFCRGVAAAAGWHDREHELFHMGLFSVIDAIMDMPMKDIVPDLPLSADVVCILLGEDNQLRVIHDAMIASERGQWATLDACAAKLGLNPAAIAEAYINAVEWARAALD